MRQGGRVTGSSNVFQYGAIDDLEFLRRAMARPAAKNDSMLALLEQYKEDEGLDSLKIRFDVIVDDPDPKYRIINYYFEKKEDINGSRET